MKSRIISLKLGYLLLLAVSITFVCMSCDGIDDKLPDITIPSLDRGSSCVSCHIDKELLKEVADPEPPHEDTGEG